MEDNEHLYVRQRRTAAHAKMFMFDSSRGIGGLKKHPYRTRKKTANDNKGKEKNSFDDAFRIFWKNMRQIIVGAEAIDFSTSMVSLIMNGQRISEFLKTNGEPVRTRPTYSIYRLSAKDAGEFNKLTKEMHDNVSVSSSIPRLLLPAVVSHYDALISRIIDSAFLARPELARGIDRKVGIEDLLKFSSIDEARRYFIDKEIDHVMRGSHQSQLDWLSDRVGITISPSDDLAHRFFEMIERRNIVIHNDGIVNQQYLEGCKRAGIATKDLNLGDKAKIDSKYVVDAANAAVEMGVQLCQVIWRKYYAKDMTQLQKADTAVNDVTYELITLKKYRLGAAIFDFCRDDIKKWSSERLKLMNIINHANLLMLSDQKDKSLTLLKTHDWSAASLDFKMCEAAIRGDAKSCAAMLRKHGKAIEIDAESYSHWPLFTHVAADQEFGAAFKEVFGVPYIPEPQSQAEIDSEQSKQDQPE